MSIKKDILFKTALVVGFVFIICILLVLQIFRIQLIEGGRLREIAKSNSTKNIKILADRGNICARDGRLLACSLPYYKIRFDCSVVDKDVFNEKLDSLSFCLSKFFGGSKNSYKNKIKRYRLKNKKYLKISERLLAYEELKEIKNFPMFRLPKNEGGLIIEKKNIRIQPHKNLANRTIGYIGESQFSAKEGRVGLENAFELELKGIDGYGIKQKMIGSWLPFSTIEPIDGRDLITTIDIDFQDLTETILEEQLKKYEAESGTVVLMEVKTGKIRAIANLGYNKKKKKYWEDYNHAVADSKEYGSVFKLATIIAVLEDGFVKPTDTIHTGNGRYKFYDRTMIDSHRGGFGALTVQEVFEKSSNVGVSRIIEKYYKGNPSLFVNRLYSMRLNECIGLSIKGEGKPKIKYPGEDDWYGTTLPWMSIGYEIQLTPLQILNLYNAVANNGLMVKPRFVEEVRYRGKVVSKFETEILSSKICSTNTLNIVKDMLEGVVERGTARNIRTKKYKIAGKTGTALVAEGDHGYKNKTYVGSFVGYFPADNPTYSCIVVISNPNKKKGFYGSIVAAPVFRKLADKVYAKSFSLHPIKNVDHKLKTIPCVKSGYGRDIVSLSNELSIASTNKNVKSDWLSVSKRKDGSIKYSELIVKDGLVPNVIGMGLMDAVFLLENMGLKVRSNGFGKVYLQSIKAGDKIGKNRHIAISLK